MVLTMFIVIALMVAVGTFFLAGGKELLRSNKKAIEPKVRLSPVAKQLVKEYNALPEDNRPFPDIEAVVIALDASTAPDAEERTNHFNDWYFNNDDKPIGNNFTFKWLIPHRHCRHESRFCKFHEYYKIHQVIADVAESVKEKERILASSSHNTQGVVKELEARLRDEADLNRTFVREFKALD